MELKVFSTSFSYNTICLITQFVSSLVRNTAVKADHPLISLWAFLFIQFLRKKKWKRQRKIAQQK